MRAGTPRCDDFSRAESRRTRTDLPPSGIAKWRNGFPDARTGRRRSERSWRRPERSPRDSGHGSRGSREWNGPGPARRSPSRSRGSAEARREGKRTIMNKAPINVQDSFFYNLRKDNVVITVRLTSGEERMGRLRRFDKFALVLEVEGREELMGPFADETIRGCEALAAGNAPAAEAAFAAARSGASQRLVAEIGWIEAVVLQDRAEEALSACRMQLGAGDPTVPLLVACGEANSRAGDAVEGHGLYRRALARGANRPGLS